MKVCPTCGKSLPTDEFGKDRIRKDGLTRTCRTCTNTVKREQAVRSAAGEARPRGRPRAQIGSWSDEERLRPVRAIPNTPEVRMTRILDDMGRHHAEEAAR